VHRLIVGVTLILAACAPAGPPRTSVFRAASAPIYSAAAFDTGRIAGRWRQVAAFNAPGTAGCGAGAVEFIPSGSGLTLTGSLCLNGAERLVSGRVTRAGPGRLAVDGMEDWWIVWVDSGYRTLAVGTPSGRFGFVLDRAALSGDRLQAAREVFDFNGYVASALTPF
jgi:apolipoprotein D and lipocalin family protein